MIKIRLTRKGARNNPFYRIVAVDERSKREGKPLAIIGWWYPRKTGTDPKASLKIDKEKLDFWLKRGAKKTLAVAKLLSK